MALAFVRDDGRGKHSKHPCFRRGDKSYEITSICCQRKKAIISGLIPNKNYLSPVLSIFKMYVV